MFLSLIGFGNLCFNQKVYAKITESELTQFKKLSKAIDVPSEKIIDCLKFSCREKNEYACELAIIDGSNEHKNCFVSLFTESGDKKENEEKSKYMQYYLMGN